MGLVNGNVGKLAISLSNSKVSTISDMGNPFEEESPDLYSLDTKDVVESGIADEILKLADKGRDQYTCRTFLSRMRVLPTLTGNEKPGKKVTVIF
jgi:hypothetical protein